MSVDASHQDTVLVVSVHGNDPDMLHRLAAVLEDVLRSRENVIIDLRELRLAPRSSVEPFLGQLASLADRSPAGVIVVADRLSARRVLNRLIRSPRAATASSVSAALYVLQHRDSAATTPLQDDE